MKKLWTTLSLLLILCLTVPAGAQEKKLGVGSEAPGLDIENWVRGSETTIEGGRTFLVAFFNTDTGRRMIPVLGDLQKEFGERGLSVLAISWEEVDVIKRFVSGQGDKLTITVAADRREGTKRAWVDAAGITETPVAFLVDRKGKIAWIGKPTDASFTALVPRVMSGRYDPRLEKQAQPAIQGADNARKVKNWRMANKYYDDVIALDAGVFASVALDKFEMILLDIGDQAAAYAYAKTLIDEKFASDGGALQMLADKIAADPQIDSAKRNMDVALEASEAARKVIGEDNPEALAGVARIRMARGEAALAIDLQKKAYFNAAPKSKPEFKRQLDIYQQQAERAASMKPAN